MGKIHKYLDMLPNGISRDMKVVSSDTDFLHISDDPNLKKMTPRIGHRQLLSEDRTIPRVSGCADLKGCIYGHSLVFATSIDGVDKEREKNSDKTFWYTIYRITGYEFVKPGKRLLPDTHMTDELWLIGYAPEAYDIRPVKVGMLLPVRSVLISNHGKQESYNVFYLYVKDKLTLDGNVLEKGYYSFTLDGDLIPQAGVHDVENLKSISRKKWETALKEIDG